MPIKICYQRYDNDAIYPKAQVCFCKLSLPVTHKDQDSFNMAFKKALEYGAGYGNVWNINLIYKWYYATYVITVSYYVAIIIIISIMCYCWLALLLDNISELYKTNS